jgi:hypothetical protein
MVVLKYTFTRPNSSVAFYSSAGNSAVREALSAAIKAKDLIYSNDSTSPDGLTLTRTMEFSDQAALNSVSANSVLASNKQARTAYNNANGITETVEMS